MKYLSEDQIIAINVVVQKQQERTPQLKDANALNDIVQSAQQEVFGIALYQDLASLATFYFLKLIKKHVFNDANKRTAFMATILFLKRNNAALPTDDQFQLDLGNLAIEVAKTDGEPEKLRHQVQSFLDQNIKLNL